uniref:Uncharacterized protein n=1 Tax=Oryza sativa subsp. japonica TaxID=39947 RepID=Q5Z6X9_ORYSJ|nr:hypothetical protein [Oryza sativa Japonica Group]
MSVRSPSLDVDGSGAESIFGSGGIGGPPISETCPPRSRRGDDVEAGIDDATLEAFTAVVYKNYGDADVLCVLPNSGNLFQLTPLVKVTPLSLGIALS